MSQDPPRYRSMDTVRQRETYRDGLRHAHELLEIRIEATRLPCCRFSLQAMADMLAVLSVDPADRPVPGEEPPCRG